MLFDIDKYLLTIGRFIDGDERVPLKMTELTSIFCIILSFSQKHTHTHAYVFL